MEVEGAVGCGVRDEVVRETLSREGREGMRRA